MSGGVKVRFLGGGREVGRSAILVEANGAKVLLDYGALLGDGKPQPPHHVAPREIVAIALTHAHLDHSGMLPFLYVTEDLPLYTTSLTAEICDLLIRDFLRLSHYYLPFELLELQSMLKNVKPVKAGGCLEVKGFKISFLNAGHIPGSLSILLEAGGRRILYTGDINTIPTRLLNPASVNLPEADCVIIESTYSNMDHTDRVKVEERLINILREVVEGGGIALIPAFSVGRSQEILSILRAHNFEHPVALDGMAIPASQILLKHPEEVKDYKLLRDALYTARWIDRATERRKVCKEPGVVISPAGMLKGGAAVEYMNRLAHDDRNAVVLVSYQIPGTPGRILLETGKYAVGKRLEKVKARVEWLDFSSHCGRKELWQIVKGLKGSPKLFTIHGDKTPCKEFASRIHEETGLEASAPENGEVFTI